MKYLSLHREQVAVPLPPQREARDFRKQRGYICLPRRGRLGALCVNLFVEGFAGVWGRFPKSAPYLLRKAASPIGEIWEFFGFCGAKR